MPFKFCPECGVAAEPEGRFCTGCGQALSGRGGGSTAPTVGIVTLACLLLLGGGFWLYLRLVPAPERPLKPGEGRSAPSAAASSGAGGTAAQQAQPHPQIALPDDIKQYIAGLAENAEAKPQDVEAWQTLARVYYRASRLDPAYVGKAEDAYEHLLGIDAKNLDALRGLGNVAYDHQDRARAIEFYGKYLAEKPDDAEVRTDLGTMLFESGQPDRAIAEYEQVIAKNPSFFQAYFNLGVVYDARGDRAAARAQLDKARDLAPDETVRQRISALIAAAADGKSFADAAEEVSARAAASGQAPPMGDAGAPVAGGALSGGAAPALGPAGVPAATFAASVEQVFRSHPIAGPKVASVAWPAEDRAQVVMAAFPMAAMPEAMRTSYLEKMKKAVAESRARFAVSHPVTIEIVDQATGEVMATITS
jgi:tetratricopeptide (TPR) repeat protein